MSVVRGLVLALLTLPKLPTSVTQLYIKFVCTQYILCRGVRNLISNNGGMIMYLGFCMKRCVSFQVVKIFLNAVPLRGKQSFGI